MTGLKADLVYASSPHLLAGLAGWAIAKRRRVPFVLEVRDLWPKVLVDMGMTTETSQLYRQLTHLEEFLYSEADAIIVFAEGVRNHLIARGVSGDLITLIPNAADPAGLLGFRLSRSPPAIASASTARPSCTPARTAQRTALTSYWTLPRKWRTWTLSSCSSATVSRSSG